MADHRADLRALEIFRYHLARMWPDRNDERTFTFPSGHVNDRSTRRASIRDNLRGQRSVRGRIAP